MLHNANKTFCNNAIMLKFPDYAHGYQIYALFYKNILVRHYSSREKQKEKTMEIKNLLYMRYMAMCLHLSHMPKKKKRLGSETCTGIPPLTLISVQHP